MGSDFSFQNLKASNPSEHPHNNIGPSSLVDAEHNIHGEKNSEGESRGEMGKSFVTTGINSNRMATLQ